MTTERYELIENAIAFEAHNLCIYNPPMTSDKTTLSPTLPPPGAKVVVAMSGGVDSSVAACLLHERGCDVTGLFMRIGVEHPEEEQTCSPDNPETANPETAPGREHQGCCSAADAADARFVAGMIGIGFYALNFKTDFDRIIDYFADEYAAGRTPNPCIQCNNWLKFGRLVEYADAISAEYVATGHYARLENHGDGILLKRGIDTHKDQTYFLFGVLPEHLRRATFPVGHLTKDRVREEAERFKLPVTAKPDSVEICFAPDRDYARVVRERRPDAFKTGDVLDADGRILGRHEGLANYTIGQRRGLRIAAGKPVYVTSLDVLSNTVILGPREDLLASALVASKPNFFRNPPTRPTRCKAQIRYQHQAAKATATILNDGRLRVDFDEPQSAITPGQAVVLYEDNVVLGGAWIDEAVSGEDEQTLQ